MVHRLVTKTPQRMNIDLLAALCDILDCTPNDLLDCASSRGPHPHAAAGETRAEALESATCGRSAHGSAVPESSEPNVPASTAAPQHRHTRRHDRCMDRCNDSAAARRHYHPQPCPGCTATCGRWPTT